MVKTVELSGRRVLAIGASIGIGEATCRALVESRVLFDEYLAAIAVEAEPGSPVL